MQKCQQCQLCVLRENSSVLNLRYRYNKPYWRRILTWELSARGWSCSRRVWPGEGVMRRLTLLRTCLIGTLPHTSCFSLVYNSLNRDQESSLITIPMQQSLIQKQMRRTKRSLFAVYCCYYWILPLNILIWELPLNNYQIKPVACGLLLFFLWCWSTFVPLCFQWNHTLSLS